MFSVGDYPLVQQAIIAFDSPLDAQWPLDEMNDALAAFYQSTLTLPWVTVIEDLSGPIGYVLLPRNDRRSDHEDVFWTCLAEGELAHAGTKEFLVDLPRWHATPHDPDAGRDPCAAVAYVAPYGPALPVGPINDAIRLVMGQQDWPESGALYLYPVRRAADPFYSGLWLADRVDGMDDDSHIDDAMFTAIREQNLSSTTAAPAAFHRKRYDW
jgi:hypothetical protein